METTETTATESTTTRNVVTQENVNRAISLMVEAEYSAEETIASFVKRGYTEDEAVLIVATAASSAKEHIKRNKGGGSGGVLNLVIGAILLIVGIGLTAASDGQAIFYGAMVVGVIQIIRGIIAMSSN